MSHASLEGVARTRSRDSEQQQPSTYPTAHSPPVAAAAEAADARDGGGSDGLREARLQRTQVLARTSSPPLSSSLLQTVEGVGPEAAGEGMPEGLGGKMSNDSWLSERMKALSGTFVGTLELNFKSRTLSLVRYLLGHP